ncbi:MAG: hypothetical protein A2X29_03210 [Elusimicrobia bacterium GWA2_64_40]|nr:MAG: hypothetical protein A2X29_03210 [Elusimicrobia bacterium GWA2_64_40]OGR66472.1 MAG: hypothetical protein A2X30_04795 [Elusimicrobia bacterium GWB2_63_16]HAN03701.1 hypothetical protein [Elusimicrobiota bacterium]
MKNLVKIAAAGLMSFNFVSYASADGALKDAGFSLEGIETPEVSAPAAAVDQAAQDLDLFRYFGYGVAPAAAELGAEKGLKGINDVVFSINLETVKNAYLKPNVSFTTGQGTKVHVSGSKASNCPNGGNSCADKDKFFLVLTTSRNESYFVRGTEIINWGILYSGSKTVTIDGEKFVVKIKANASTPENSMLEIKGPRGMALNTSLKSVGDGVASKGVDVKLGKNYKLAYGNEIVQGPQGARFTDKTLVLLIPFPVVDATSYYIFKTDEIKPSGVTFPSFERGYGFKLNGGKLDIYRL